MCEYDIVLRIYGHFYQLSGFMRVSACLTTNHEVAGSIPGTSTNFKCGLDLERGARCLMKTIG